MRLLPKIVFAESNVSLEVEIILTPPDLPLPPECIWAFIIAVPVISFFIATASSGEEATRPLGIGTP